MRAGRPPRGFLCPGSSVGDQKIQKALPNHPLAQTNETVHHSPLADEGVPSEQTFPERRDPALLVATEVLTSGRTPHPMGSAAASQDKHRSKTPGPGAASSPRGLFNFLIL